ncbi:hypothetical protein JYT20_01390 [Rhodothermus sp. AH-315-K08]|nr:hypothetical protein [Rhodothermus sp. AH-315-K08]
MRTFLLALLLSGCAPSSDSGESPQTSANDIPEVVSLLGTALYPPQPDSSTAARQLEQLAEAQANFDAAPEDVDSYVWLGRRTAYMWQYHAAIQIYSDGLDKHPDSPHLLRHRGHRYMSVRDFDNAIADFARAAELTNGLPDEVEPDGQPNAAGIPTSTLQTNIWYHLALAHFYKGDFVQAAAAMQTCLDLAANNDMKIAAADWLYMALRRSDADGADASARMAIDFVTPDLPILENHSYHRRILMYKGLVSPDSLLGAGEALDMATQGYGVGNYYLLEGDSSRAQETFRAVLETGYWAAFGYIAAEADLARMAEH